MKISDLEANSKVVNLVVAIQTLDEARTTEGGTPLQEGVLSDETGQVQITFWQDQVGKFKAGDKIEMTTGWCKEFESELQVSSGKFGKINLVKE